MYQGEETGPDSEKSCCSFENHFLVEYRELDFPLLCEAATGVETNQN